MAEPLDDFLIPITSGVVDNRQPGELASFFDRDRLARLHADLDALADHRGAVLEELRNGACRG